MSYVYHYDPGQPNGCGTLQDVGIDLLYFPAFENRLADVHTIDVPMLSCVLSGTGTHFLCEQSFAEQGCSVTLVNSGQSHDIVTEHAMEIMNLFVDPKRMSSNSPMREALTALDRVFPIHNTPVSPAASIVHVSLQPRESVNHVLFALREELLNRRDPSSIIAGALLSVFTSMCVRELRQPEGGRRAAEPDPRIVLVRHFIDNNFAAPVSIDSLSDVAGVSPSHLCRLFKAECGETVFSYLIGRRIEAAKMRLTTDDSKVLAIALETGFDDLSHFYRSFRSRVGMSPTEYRRLLR